MIKLLEFLLVGCWHQWKTDKRLKVIGTDNINIGEAVFCTCTKCGTPKRFDLY